MFSLLYGFWEYLSRKEELRILILGLDKSGKRPIPEILHAASYGTHREHLTGRKDDSFCREDNTLGEAEDYLH